MVFFGAYERLLLLLAFTREGSRSSIGRSLTPGFANSALPGGEGFYHLALAAA
jgi:hypothetical protein